MDETFNDIDEDVAFDRICTKCLIRFSTNNFLQEKCSLCNNKKKRMTT
jgi:hypothetical protein